MNRRRLLPLATGLALLVTLSACAGSGGTAPTTAAEQAPASGGTLTWAVESEPNTLNPQLNGQAAARPLMRSIGDSYLYRDGNGEYHPWLAESWTASEDGTTISLDLRDGVTFTDGEALDADAVVQNFELLKDPTYGANDPGLAWLTSFRAVDEDTVEFTLEKPDNLFLAFLSTTPASPISPASLDRGAEALKAGGADVALTGPFVIEEYQQGNRLVLTRNEGYTWAPEDAVGRQGPAWLDQVSVRFLKEAATRTGALSSGQVDLIDSVPSQDVPLFADQPSFRNGEYLNGGTPYNLYLNVSKAPLDDVRVRQALQQGADYAQIVESIYYGVGTVAQSPISPTSNFHDPSVEDAVTFDVDAANRLLDEAGWTGRDAEGFRTRDGQRLTVVVNTGAPFVRDSRLELNQAISASLKQGVGIDYSYRPVDLGTEAELTKANEYDVFDNSYIAPDAGTALDLLWSSDPTRGFISRVKHADPKVDELIDTARSETDQAARTEAYQEFQRYVLAEQAYVVPIYVQRTSWASTPEVQGVTADEATGTIWGAYTISVAR